MSGMLPSFFLDEGEPLISVSDSIMRLLASKDERDLECFAGLLRSAGKMLDVPKAEGAFNKYFTRIQSLSKDQSLSSRIKFMLMVLFRPLHDCGFLFFPTSFLFSNLQDLIDLRKDKWVPRREESKAKKIEEIHLEAKLEEARKSSGGTGSRSDTRRSSGRPGMPTLEEQGLKRRAVSQGPLIKNEPAHVNNAGFSKDFGQQRPFAPPTFRKGPSSAAPAPTLTSNKFE